MLLLVHENCLFAYGAGIWNFTWGNEAWYRFSWRNIRFITWIGLVSSIQSLVWIANIHVTMPCFVTAYVFVKLSRNQSWVNLLFSVLRDSILDSLFLILDSHRNRELRIESRIETCNGLSLTFEWSCIQTSRQYLVTRLEARTNFVQITGCTFNVQPANWFYLQLKEPIQLWCEQELSELLLLLFRTEHLSPHQTHDRS